MLGLGVGDDLVEVIGDFGDLGGRGRVCGLVGRFQRKFGLLGVEIVEARLEAREPGFAALGRARIEARSVDIVTTRSVLIYVADKESAFQGFGRVLRPGGRISLFEPINRFATTTRRRESWAGYDLTPLGEIGGKLRAVYDALQPPDADPMLDFDERDLIRLAEETGFFPIELYLDAEIKPAEPRNWEAQQLGQPEHPNHGRSDGAGSDTRRAQTPRRVPAPARRNRVAVSGAWQAHTSSPRN